MYLKLFYSSCINTYNTMKKQIENYVLGKSVGAGSYGKVHLGENIKTKETVAFSPCSVFCPTRSAHLCFTEDSYCT